MNALVLLRAVFDPAATRGVYAGPYVLDLPAESAIALARQWRASMPAGRVIGIAVGPPEWDSALRTALMLGCDEALRIWSESLEGADILTVAAAIAAHLPPGITTVIAGGSSTDPGSGLLPAAVAATLGWAFAGDVTALSDGDGGLTITVRRDGGRRERLRTNHPVVIAGARMPPPPFYPRVARCIASRRAVIPCVQPSAQRAFARVEVVSYGPARPRTQHLLQPRAGSNPAQRLRQLMAGGVANRASKTVAGAGEESGKKLAELLAAEGFLP